MFEEISELYKARLAEAERDRVDHQAMVQLVATIEKISQEGRSSQSIAASLKMLEDEVNRQSK
jgi:hypothetical protein